MSKQVASLVFVVMVAALSQPIPARSQQAAAETAQPKQVVGEEADAIQSLNGFVAANATLAGAAAACQLPLSTVILQCTGLTIRNWNSVSGLAPFPDAKAAMKLSKQVWGKYFNVARDAQASIDPPLTCAQVEVRASAAPALGVCGPALPSPQDSQPRQAVPQPPQPIPVPSMRVQ